MTATTEHAGHTQEALHRADGIELIGEMTGSGYKVPPSLVRRAEPRISPIAASASAARGRSPVSPASSTTCACDASASVYLAAFVGACVYGYVDVRPAQPIEVLGVLTAAWLLGSGAALTAAVLLPPLTGVRCPLAIGLDGQMMDASFSIDDMAVSGVHGIEMYTGSARVPVVANVDGEAKTAASPAIDALVAQISAPVRWEAVVGTLASAGVRAYVEVGPGTVLSGLVRKIHREARVTSLESPDQLDAVEAVLREAVGA